MKKIPKPPGPLNKDGKKFYDDIANYLVANDLIQDIDALLIYQAAKWWEVYMVSVKGVQELGTTVVYASGHQQVSPNVTNMMKAHVAFNKLLDKLGVGEAARQKLKIGAAVEGHDPMDEI